MTTIRPYLAYACLLLPLIKTPEEMVFSAQFPNRRNCLRDELISNPADSLEKCSGGACPRQDSNPWFTCTSCSFISSREGEERRSADPAWQHDRAGATETAHPANSVRLTSTASEAPDPPGSRHDNTSCSSFSPAQSGRILSVEVTCSPLYA
jgi:hypothetical protein